MTENRGEYKGEFITEEMDYATVAGPTRKGTL